VQEAGEFDNAVVRDAEQPKVSGFVAVAGDMERSGLFMDFGAFSGVWMLWIGYDICNRLFDEALVVLMLPFAELLQRPGEHILDIPPGLVRYAK
jgi:hypothetical protein